MLGIFKDGYQPHQYAEWLLKNVAAILDADLAIGSAGLLKGGRQAWVSVETPDTITTPEGVAYRPNLLAVASFDGSLATTYKPVVTNVVCDNTMAAGLREAGPQFKVKSTRNSMGRLSDAREALGIVHTIADDFAFGYESTAGFPRTFEQNGGKVVQKLWAPLNVADYGTYISEIDPSVDAVVINFAG